MEREATKSLPERIMEYAEATPLQADDLLHLGHRASVDVRVVPTALGSAGSCGYSVENLWASRRPLAILQYSVSIRAEVFD